MLASTFSQFRNSQRSSGPTNEMSPSMDYFSEISDASGLMVHKHHFNNSFQHLFFKSWMAFQAIHRPLFTESQKIEFPNNNSVSKNYNGAFCEVGSKYATQS